MKANLAHMQAAHDFRLPDQATVEQSVKTTDIITLFILNIARFDCKIIYQPSSEYLISPEEFFLYLADKVGQGNMCLVCNYKGKAFYSLQVF